MAGKAEKLVLEIARPAAEKLGFLLVDVEYKKEGPQRILYVYIDKAGGVTVDDCEAMSHELDGPLDTLDIIQEHYYLCVSSPGLDRPFKDTQDFARNLQREIEIRLYAPLQGKKEITGILKSYDETSITLEMDARELIIKRSDIALARQAVRF
jgi:ribosome maturation factor RimP